MKLRVLSGLAVGLLAASGFAQTASEGPRDEGQAQERILQEKMRRADGQRDEMRMREEIRAHGSEMHMRQPTMPGGPGDHMGMMGKWWKNSELVQRIGLTDQQVQQIEKIFQDHRLQLIDLHAGLEKQEAVLEPLMEADRVDDAQVAQVVAQIDRIAQARAALEKSHATMLLGIRRVLSAEQWKKLHSGLMGPGMRMPALPPPPPGEMD
jgi:Spy/CpxP family protein refolding chaperone